MTKSNHSGQIDVTVQELNNTQMNN